MKKNRIYETRVAETPARDANRDPITGAPGAHPVGTGVGATGGGAAGAAIGAAVGGPVGAAVGLAAGAVAGGLAGKGAAEAVNPTIEDAYWRDNYSSQTWVERTYTYDDYQPASAAGTESYARYGQSGKLTTMSNRNYRRIGTDRKANPASMESGELAVRACMELGRTSACQAMPIEYGR
jgi:hypothetical protein